jgi:hypothetical protein
MALALYAELAHDPGRNLVAALARAQARAFAEGTPEWASFRVLTR